MRRKKRSKSTTTAIMAVVVVIACLMLSVFPSKSANKDDIIETTSVVDVSPLMMSATMVQYSAKPDSVDVSHADDEDTEIVEEEPVIIVVEDETPPEENNCIPNPYADLELTFEEKELLACMAYNESRGEPFEGQIAVIQVALNRYMHEAYSGSISDILLAPYQFSVGSTYTEEQMNAVEAALAGDPVLDLNTDVVYFSTGGLTYGTYYCTIGGHVFRTYH